MQVILGSSSPRRKHILEGLFPTLTICHPNVNEIPQKNETPLEFVIRASKDKMNDIINKINPYTENNDALLITCDTIVTINSLILGKPKDYYHACSMLKMLSGATHAVISSITLSYICNERIHIYENDFEITHVTFKPLTDQDIALYLSSIYYLDKAGSYAIQDNGKMIISSIEGSITNVIGFPLRCFFRMLASSGIISKLF